MVKVNTRVLRNELLKNGFGYMWVGNNKYLSKSWRRFSKNTGFSEVNEENVKRYIDYLFRG